MESKPIRCRCASQTEEFDSSRSDSRAGARPLERATLSDRTNPVPQLVVHAVPSLALATGGPSRSVPGLCAGLASAGWAIRLVTVDDPYLGLAANVPDGRVALIRARGIHVLGYSSYSPDLYDTLLRASQDAPIVHSHGIWSQANWVSARVTRTSARAHIIAPRGMLEPWAIARSAWKKRLAGVAFQDRALREAACIHVTAEQEYRSVRAYGLQNPVAIVPNGLDIGEYTCALDRKPVHAAWPESAGKRIALFLSRIHPKKGLVHLARAWGAVAPRRQDWHLVIAGPDEGGHEAEVREAINCAGVTHRTTFAGPVYGEARRNLYNACDLFVLPTFSENFGIVIAEALASGKPVITTRGAPWQEIAAGNCGWYIDIGVEPLAAALEEAMESSVKGLLDMGGRGRQLIERCYGWSSIAQRMADAYRWVLAGGEPPACVRVD